MPAGEGTRRAEFWWGACNGTAPGQRRRQHMHTSFVEHSLLFINIDYVLEGNNAVLAIV
jgi:hypothetical protein